MRVSPAVLSIFTAAVSILNPGSVSAQAASEHETPGTYVGSPGAAPPRTNEIGVSFVLTRVKYPVPDRTAGGTVVVVPGETTEVYAPGVEVMYGRLLTRLKPKAGERGKLTTDIRLELPVAWSPEVNRAEGPDPPPYSILSVTPRIALRLPADRRAQMLVAMGAGVSHYREERGNESVRQTSGVYHLVVGGQFELGDAVMLRVEYGGTSIDEPSWLGRGSLRSSGMRIGAVVAF